MRRRPAATLLEVLVAIFVMAIGMLAILVLFPLGALRMAQAIQSERAAHVAVAASALGNAGQLRTDANVAAAMLGQNNGLPLPAPEDKSYPVLVDPIGYVSAFGAASNRVAGLAVFPRTYPGYIPVANLTNPAVVLPLFASLDDLYFERNGTVRTALIGNVTRLERDTRYSWTYLLQRPRSADTSVVDCTVLVYDSRPLALVAGNLDLPETGYGNLQNGVSEVTYDPASNLATIRYEYFNRAIPPVRPGDWILDLSQIAAAGRVDRHAYSYRVAGLTDGVEEIPAGSGNFFRYLTIETQNSLRGFAGTYAGATARLVILEGVAEVFERGLGKNP